MDVVDRPYHSLRRINISIVAAARLPKITSDSSVGLSYRQPLQPPRIRSSQEIHRLSAYGLLDRGPDLADVVCALLRKQDHVDVFGHDDVTPKVEVVYSACLLKSVHEPLASPVFAEKLVSMITGKRQLVSVSGQVEVLTQVANRSVW